MSASATIGRRRRRASRSAISCPEAGSSGALMRAYPWETTPLGPPESWPQSLKMAIRIMLTSRQPIWIGWGEDLTYFYNDPYKSIIGGKHPWALGRPTREVWREIWPQIGPMLDTALGGDQGTYVESQLLIMERNGYPEETYYTFSYSPIPNDDGTVGGIFCANSDDTQRVIGERQLALLKDLAAEAGHARNWREACVRGAVALEKNPRDLPFAHDLCRRARRRHGASSRAPPASSGATRSRRRRSTSDRRVALADRRGPEVAERPDRVGPAGAGGRRRSRPGPGRSRRPSAALIPILPTGDTGRAGVLVVGLNPFRLFDDNYRGFLSLAAGQIAAAIANAQAYEEERRRAEALAEIDRAKTTFFSNISHEFRTPLTLMLGPIEDVLQEAPAHLPPVHRNRLETAHRNSLRLLKLVNSLLDFSRIEAGRTDMNFEPVDLAQLTAEARVELRVGDRTGRALARGSIAPTCPSRSMSTATCGRRSSSISCRTPSSSPSKAGSRSNSSSSADRRCARADRPRHRRRHSAIRAADAVRALPSDRGPEEPLVRRLRHRPRPGAGAGEAARRDDGGRERGWARARRSPSRFPFGAGHLPPDRIGKGRVAGFDVAARRRLRRGGACAGSRPTATDGEAPDDRADDAPDFPFQGRTAGSRILVADDNADMRNYVRRLLQSRWDVEAVSDGCVALEAIRARKPDLVLTDVMMPGLDGFGLLRELRGDAALRDIPVIVLSARAGEDARVEGLDAKADDYLTKPFSARELIARVNANLEMALLRRETTRELRESEARFRNMADHAPVMMWMTDPTGSLTYLNRLWTEFTGQPAGGGARLRRLGGACIPTTGRRRDSAFCRGQRRAQPVPARIPAPAQTTAAIAGRSSAAGPRFGDDGEFLGHIGSVIDITDRKEAEQILRQANESLEQRVAGAIAERAEGRGATAAGAEDGGGRQAHRRRRARLQQRPSDHRRQSATARRDVAGNPRAEQRLQTAIAAISRGSKLASQLLAFGRRQPLAPKVVNLGRLIRSTDDMLRRALGDGVEIETVISGGLWNTFVDTVQVENALLNLAINARDAMEGHGKLTIEAGNAYLDDDYAVRHADVTAGQYVMIAVTDTGPGFPPDVIEHVFEPFFTTKPEGRGTGLGLSMVYGFVKQSGGHIKIYSEPGHGTTVRIYLPRAKGIEDAEPERRAGPATGGGETVLVVEDDEQVRGTVVDLLSELGYRVLKAKDAAERLDDHRKRRSDRPAVHRRGDAGPAAQSGARPQGAGAAAQPRRAVHLRIYRERDRARRPARRRGRAAQQAL